MLLHSGRHALLSAVGLLLPAFLFAQKGVIEGTLRDDATGETLIGATVKIADSLATATDIDGHYHLEAPYGTYTLKVTYVGFEEQSKPLVVDAPRVVLDMKLKSITLSEVQVVADVAVNRRTPVAFSTIEPRKITEELASRDIPMLLNSTPGVYATTNGGGDGDARITLRGFSQSNVAVMLDGVPVNDMENGAVYWSNWFGLDATTRSIQVQRGLGASKIAIPSVGGTINILTKGIEQKGGLIIKQEAADHNYLRTTLSLNSGRMKGDWGITVAGSYKKGDGWVDQTWTEGWFYFAKIEKRLGKHTLSLSGFGAPQQHGQRAYKLHIGTYSADFARDQGIDVTDADDYGRQYNQHWGTLERFDYAADGTRSNVEGETLNERKNYYHKPQFSLRDLWQVNDRLYVSNVAYLSIGNGGGTRLTNSTPPQTADGQVDFQHIYNENSGYAGLSTPSPFDDNLSHKSSNIIRSLVNNHFWYGLLTTATYKINENLDLSGGLDLRSYRGEHYGEVYDLLGGNYYMNTSGRDENAASDTVRIGDKMSYHNSDLVQWGGAFFQLEHHTPALSWFVSGTIATTGYQRTDYFRKRDLEIDGHFFSEAVGYGDVFYWNGSSSFTALRGATVTSNGDTTFVNNVGTQPDGYIVGASPYTHEYSGATDARTSKKWIPGFNVKGGGNYNLNEWNNVFVNVGFMSNAPRFDYVFDFTNKLFANIENEQVMAVETGYSFRQHAVAFNVNTYYTYWKNKPVDLATTVRFGDEQRKVNINGMNARHMGVEMDLAWNITAKWTLEGLASLADWTWQSKVENLVLRDEDGRPALDPGTGQPVYINFDARGVHVGNAAQTQVGAMVRFEPIKHLYFKVRGTYFARQYADFDPFSLTGVDAQRESWMAPNYLLTEAHAGYGFNLKKTEVLITASVLNALDTYYIADARNNDGNVTPASYNFDATSASVFFGEGRRWNVGVKLTF
ncbi:MAG: TonB-dependent receptor [Flavobacteriales bacterium]